MKLGRITHHGLSGPRFARIDGDKVYPLAEGKWFDELDSVDEMRFLPLAEANLLAPVVPSKIVCVGRNYLEHALELGNKMPDEPLLFLKAPSAVIASGERIMLPPQSHQVEHEGEVGVVIARSARKLSDDEDPLSYV